MKFIKRTDGRYGESECGRFTITRTTGAYVASRRGARGWELLTGARFTEGDEIGRMEAWGRCVAACENYEEKGDV